MGLDPRQYGIAGFILIESKGNSDELKPDGTFFMISVPNPDSSVEVGFVVTAQHNVIGRPRVWAAMKTVAGETARWELSNHWFFPVDHTIDLAIHPLMGDQDDVHRLPRPWPIGLTSTTVGAVPRHGAPMLYAGLHLPIKATWEEFTPIVRFGTMAAIMHPGITWGKQDQWGPTEAHLIDCQAIRGYSGAPVFMESQYPGPRVQLPDAPPTLPEPWERQLEASDWGLGRNSFGTIYNFHALVGMMAAIDESGIGIVLPVGQLHALVGSEDVQTWIVSNT